MTTQTSTRPQEVPTEPAGLSPFTIEFFLVQGVGFRCMAFCDDEGIWREAFYNRELPGPIQILQ